MMGIFSNNSLFDSDIEKVTPEEDKNNEDWGSILDICDKVGSASCNAKECLKSIIRRLNNPNPHVVLKAITLLDACVNNCSRVFHLEVASREFEQEYRKLLKKAQPKVAESLKLLLKKWAENEFKSDPQLSLIPSLYKQLKTEGVDFSVIQESLPKNSNSSNFQSKDPNAVTSQQEVDDIAKAIELSLKETNPLSGQNNLYPSTSNVIGSRILLHNNMPKQSKHLVKALYDFEAVEDNELTFYSGETIEVLDDSDKNWWKGLNHRGEGLFPANFVTSDVFSSSGQNPENEKVNDHNEKGHFHFNNSIRNNAANESYHERIVIDEQKIDRLLHLLHEANPTDESADTEEMITLEDEVNTMGPLIDTELEKVDRKHAQLTQLSSNLVDALNLYHSLMREPFQSSAKTNFITPILPLHSIQHPHQIMYNGGANGRFSMPPNSSITEQYPNPTLQQTNIHSQITQQPPAHYMSVAAVPIQSDGFHHQPVIANPPPSYTQNLSSNVPVDYNTTSNTMNAPQSLYQQIPSNESASLNNLQNRQ